MPPGVGRPSIGAQFLPRRTLPTTLHAAAFLGRRARIRPPAGVLTRCLALARLQVYNPADGSFSDDSMDMAEQLMAAW